MKTIVSISMLMLVLGVCFAAAQDVTSVNLNSASLKDLEKLQGVGPALAKKIIDGRPYAGVDDLLRVNGIGKKKLVSIKASGAFVE